MYKKDLAAGTVSVVFDSDANVYKLIQINEETGAVAVIADYNSTNFRIADSVDALASAPVQGTSGYYAGSNHWINGLILIHNKFYDSNGDVVRTLPDLVAGWALHSLFGNDTDGYFLWHSHMTVTERRLYAYDWESNGIAEMWRLQFQEQGGCVVDTESAEGLVGDISGQDTVIKRTADGINWTPVPGNTGMWGSWYGNLFQHININVAWRAYWDGNIDTVGNNTLFPNYVDGVFYAGKKMLINGNRLWDIVPK